MTAHDSSRVIALQDLEELHRRLSAGPDGDYQKTWRLFAASARYRQELLWAAVRLLRGVGLPAERAGDVVHDALLIMAECLQRKGNLGFDPRYGKGSFLAWIRAVARLHCRHALRRQRRRERRGGPICEEWAALDDPSAAWHDELADAIQSLEPPWRAVLVAFSRHGSVAAVADELGLSTTTAWRRYREALRKLRERCRPSPCTGRLTGVSRVVKKW